MEYSLKILGLLCLLMFQSCFGEDLFTINQSIDNSQVQIQNHPYDARMVVLANSKFEKFLPILKKCIDDEDKEIQQFSKEIDSLKKINNLQFGFNEKSNRLKLFNEHQDRKAFCEFIILKINRLQNYLSSSNQKMYEINLFNKQENIMKAFSQFDEPLVRKLPLKSGFTQYVRQSNTKNIVKLTLGIFFVLIFFKMLNLSNLIKTPLLGKISLTQYLHVALIFFIFSPTQYILLKIVYSHHDEVTLMLFHKLLVQVMLIGFLTYVYFFYKNHSFKKDLILVFAHVFFITNIMWLCFELNYLLINNYSNLEILVKKYLILFLLQPVLYSVLYWSFQKILKINLYYKFLPWLFFFFTNFIFILGLIGYVDLAVNFDFIIIIDSICMIWLFIMRFLKNTLFSILDDPQHSLHQWIDRVFQTRSKLVILNIKVVSSIFYIFSISFMLFSILFFSGWFIPEEIFQKVYAYFYSEKMIGFFNFSFARIIQSIALFCILNLINFAASQYLASKLVQDKVSRQKTTSLFNWMGYMFSMLIILKFIGFNLQDFMIIFGGLSLGVGLGLKNLLSSLISSVILFINRPFKIGDYIEIGQTKGYVKKISLLETSIETADSNTMILPNQYVASSVIQNFTYENKAFQKVHLYYTINNLKIVEEENIKNKILQELRKNAYLHESSHQNIKITFSLLEQATDIFRLEIIFSLKNDCDLNSEMPKINRNIHEKLKKMHLDVHYENMQYPFK